MGNARLHTVNINGKVQQLTARQVHELPGTNVSITTFQKKVRDINELPLPESDKQVLRNKARFTKTKTWRIMMDEKVRMLTTENILKLPGCVYEDAKTLERDLMHSVKRVHHSRHPQERYKIIVGSFKTPTSREEYPRRGFTDWNGIVNTNLWPAPKSIPKDLDGWRTREN